MKILLVSATAYEIDPILNSVSILGNPSDLFSVEYKQHTIIPLVTGIGSMMTAYALGRFRSSEQIDLAINVGIAGSFDPRIAIGNVVMVEKDTFADLGSEDADGSFLDIFSLGLLDKNSFPYEDGWIYHHFQQKLLPNLEKVVGITVNKTSGNSVSIEKLRTQYNPQIESMEGAAFFYACKIQDIPSIQIRSISNYVEPRNRANWQISKAISNLRDSTVEFIDSLH